VPLPTGGLAAPDAIEAWAGRNLNAAVRGVRSSEIADKIALHLARFRDHFHAAHGHDRLTAVVQREVIAWRSLYRAKTPFVGVTWTLEIASGCSVVLVNHAAEASSASYGSIHPVPCQNLSHTR
jgi:hypothetical protein